MTAGGDEDGWSEVPLPQSSPPRATLFKVTRSLWVRWKVALVCVPLILVAGTLSWSRLLGERGLYANAFFCSRKLVVVPRSYEASGTCSDVFLQAFLPDLKGIADRKISGKPTLHDLEQQVSILVTPHAPTSMNIIEKWEMEATKLGKPTKQGLYHLYPYTRVQKPNPFWNHDLFADGQPLRGIVDCDRLQSSSNPTCDYITMTGSSKVTIFFSRSHLGDWQDIRAKVLDLLHKPGIYNLTYGDQQPSPLGASLIDILRR